MRRGPSSTISNRTLARHEISSRIGSRSGSACRPQLRSLEAHVGGSAVGDAPPADVDPEVRERLAALGYVGLVRRPRPRAIDTGRADPKDKIELFNLMSSARNRSREDPEGSFKEVVGAARAGGAGRPASD